uniref:Guanylate cyclase domain-containing protein n=1 Tax=Streptomyces sp. NBC_00119 TaxID=2975659 RepID=A0AAU1TZ68_9ACTN
MPSPAPFDATDVPPEHALLTVDMKEYSQLPEAKMAPARADLDSMLTTVFAQCGIGDATLLGAVKDRGDGAIFVLPARHAARLVDPLLVHLGQALERREQTRLASAPTIRLRASVHVGPLAPPHHRGDAANDACRLVDSDAARRAMTAAVDHGMLLAAAVSDTIFGRTVAAGRTPALKEHHFHRAIARVEGKPGFEQTCWLIVPGLVPSVLAPYLSQDSGAVPADRPRQAAQGSTKDTTAKESSDAVRQKGRASGKARLIQVGRDYIPSQEQS